MIFPSLSSAWADALGISDTNVCSRRQASGAVLAALSLFAIQGPARAANAFLSPEARSKELAKK